MRVIIIPDDGEWVLVPKVATARMLTALWNHKDADSPALLDEAYRAALAAAPPEPTPSDSRELAHTLCWRCNVSYGMNRAQCPSCFAANANVDFAKALEQQAEGA